VCLVSQIDLWHEQTTRSFHRVILNSGHFLVRDNAREIVDVIREAALQQEWLPDTAPGRLSLT
jgi:surfactin synthase thioesterase subunit